MSRTVGRETNRVATLISVFNKTNYLTTGRSAGRHIPLTRCRTIHKVMLHNVYYGNHKSGVVQGGLGGLEWPTQITAHLRRLPWNLISKNGGWCLWRRCTTGQFFSAEAFRWVMKSLRHCASGRNVCSTVWVIRGGARPGGTVITGHMDWLYWNAGSIDASVVCFGVLAWFIFD
jgi:hypothetical protein